MTKSNSKPVRFLLVLLLLASATAVLPGIPSAQSQSLDEPANEIESENASPSAPFPDENAKKAWQILNASIIQLIDKGPAFEAKLRQVTRVEGQEVRAVGRYIQSSRSRGLMRMELQSSINNKISRFEQTCDGRLVWTREQVGDDVRIRRVDVGRLDEIAYTTGISARFKVGGLPELLDSIAWDYDLKLVRGVLKETQQVWILRGKMKSERLQQLLDEHELKSIPDEMPTHVRVAIAADGPFRLIPVRMEFSGDPVSGSIGPSRLISEMDIYELTAIQPPKEELFRYNTSEEDAHFTNETQDYIDRFQMRMASLPGYRSMLR
ncbi:MAG: hypothetical protein R3C05_13440 [Pirellulaceae bacterium]